MWRFAAFVLFFTLIASAGHRDAWQAALSNARSTARDAMYSAARDAMRNSREAAYSATQTLVHNTREFMLGTRDVFYRAYDGLVTDAQSSLALASDLASDYASGIREEPTSVLNITVDGAVHKLEGAAYNLDESQFLPASGEGPAEAWGVIMVSPAQALAPQSPYPSAVAFAEHIAREAGEVRIAPDPEAQGAVDTAEAHLSDAHVPSEAHVPMPLPMPQTAAETANASTSPGTGLAGQIQTELVRLGCYEGPPDNVWGSSAGSAVRRVNRLARMRMPSVEPTFEALNALKVMAEPVCGPEREQANKDEMGVQAGKREERPAPPQNHVENVDAKLADRGGESYLPPWMAQGGQGAAAVARPEPQGDGDAIEPGHRRKHRVGDRRRGSHSARRAHSHREGRSHWRMREHPRPFSVFSFFN